MPRFVVGFAAPLIVVLSLLGRPSFADTKQLLRFETDLLSFDVSGDELAKVEIVDDYSGNPALMMTFSPGIWQKFANFTKSAVGGRMMIFVCGSVVTDPIILHAIADGAPIISGGDIDFDALKAVLERKDCNTLPVS